MFTHKNVMLLAYALKWLWASTANFAWNFSPICRYWWHFIDMSSLIVLTE